MLSGLYETLHGGSGKRQMATLQLWPSEPFNFRNPDNWPRPVGDAASSTFTSHPDSVPSKKANKSARSSTASERKPNMSSDPQASRETSGRITKYIALGKFDGYFQVGRNIIYERARFNRRNQDGGETAEKYITELYTL